MAISTTCTHLYALTAGTRLKLKTAAVLFRIINDHSCILQSFCLLQSNRNLVFSEGIRSSAVLQLFNVETLNDLSITHPVLNAVK